jgi:hypothetical protein
MAVKFVIVGRRSALLRHAITWVISAGMMPTGSLTDDQAPQAPKPSRADQVTLR